MRVHLSNSGAHSQQLVGARRSATEHPSTPYPQLLAGPIPPADSFFFRRRSPCQLRGPLVQVFPASSLFGAGWLRAGEESVRASWEPRAGRVGEAGPLYLGRTDHKQQLPPNTCLPGACKQGRAQEGFLSRAGQGLLLGQTKGGHFPSKMSRSSPP